MQPRSKSVPHTPLCQGSTNDCNCQYHVACRWQMWCRFIGYAPIPLISVSEGRE
jgi:hypothetical protein